MIPVWLAFWIWTHNYWSTPQMITFWAGHYEIDPEYAICIAVAESSLDPNIPGDDGKAVGLYQWHLPSWEYVRERMGEPLDDLRIDSWEATRTAMYAMGKLDLGRWWMTDAGCR